MLTNDELAKWDRENFFHPSTHLAQFARGEAPQRIVTGGEGSHITDRDGNRVLDGFAGLYCVNVGYGRQEIAEAIGDTFPEVVAELADLGYIADERVDGGQSDPRGTPDHDRPVHRVAASTTSAFDAR